MSAWNFETRKRYDLTLAEHDYPPWQGPPRRTLLLCCEARSGSTLLGEALYFAGSLGCPLEYFHAGFRPDFEVRWQAHKPDDYLAAAHRNRTAPNGTFATKLFWRDVVDLLDERDPALAATTRATLPAETAPDHYREIAATLADLFAGADLLHLERIDRVRGAVSADLAVQTGLWRAIPGVGEQVPLAEPVFDFDRITSLIRYTMRAHAHWRNLFAAIGVAPIGLTYERLTRDYVRTVGDVLTRLGVPAVIAPQRMQRQATPQSDAFMFRYLVEDKARAEDSG